MSKWVLDASALLALLHREPGREHVRQALKDGAAMSTVNLSEVVAKLIDVGVPDTSIRGTLGALGLATVEFDSELAYKAGLLRAATRRAGLSLGDRACLSLAEYLGLPALTADRAWASLGLGISVRVIR